MVRSGDEPAHARSPLRLRLGLAVLGLAVSAAVGALFLREGSRAGAVFCAGCGLLSLLDAGFAVRRIRQGAHYQPGPSIPPYRPLPGLAPVARPRASVTDRTRLRRYLLLMGVCLGLLLVAWVGVRPYSTTVTVLLTVLAMLIPPIAAVVANAGWRGPGPTDPDGGADDDP